MEAKNEAIKHKIEKTEWRDENKAVGMEKDAIEIYEKLIRGTKGEKERAVFKEILNDEKDHLEKLNRILKEE